MLPDDLKAVIVLDPSLPLGLLTNAAAYLALTMGQRLPSLLGPDVVDGSGLVHQGTSALALPILSATAAKLADIHRAAAAQPELLALSFTDAAQRTLTYADYVATIASRPTAELIYFGVALAGPPRRVNALTGNLRLLR
jgi:hypothetical protein